MEIVERDGVRYIRTVRTVDFGKAGVATVIGYDPCITEEQQEARRKALVAKCQELFDRGEICV